MIIRTCTVLPTWGFRASGAREDAGPTQGQAVSAELGGQGALGSPEGVADVRVVTPKASLEDP